MRWKTGQTAQDLTPSSQISISKYSLSLLYMYRSYCRHFMDEVWLKEALIGAELALNENEVPVGCVIVQNGSIIARGHNETNATCNATRHAEMVAIDAVLAHIPVESRGSAFRDCELYVTIEPCVMCASALRQLGMMVVMTASPLEFKRVVFGASNPRFGGCGSVFSVHKTQTLPRSKHEGFECISGVCKEQSIDILKKFYSRENDSAPEDKRKRKSQ